DITQSGLAQLYGDVTKVSAGGNLLQSDNALVANALGANTGGVSINIGKDITETANASISGQNLSIAAGGNVIQSDFANIRSSGATRITAQGVSLTGNAQLLAPAMQLNLGSGDLAMSGSSRLGGRDSAITIA